MEIIAVVCSSRTEKDSSSVFREDVLVALEVVTILWMRSSSESTRVKSWVRLEVVDVASESCGRVFFFGGGVTLLLEVLERKRGCSNPILGGARLSCRW